MDYNRLYAGLQPPIYVLDNEQLFAGLLYMTTSGMMEYDRLFAGVRALPLCRSTTASVLPYD